jgi:membrane protease YdiL (CAAX protease family)
MASERFLVSFMMALFVAIISIVVISQVHRCAYQWFGEEQWLSIALLHTFVSIMAIAYWSVRGCLWEKFFAVENTNRLPQWLRRFPYPLEIGSLALVIGAFLISLAGVALDPIGRDFSPSFSWPFVLWVPVIEEICYRGLLGDIFLRIFPGFLGVWFSAAVFAILHLDIGLEHLLAGNIGLPLGPFFLGLICMTGYYWKRSLLGPIIFHCSANSTVYIFSSVDPRWLNFFSIFYS